MNGQLRRRASVWRMAAAVTFGVFCSGSSSSAGVGAGVGAGAAEPSFAVIRPGYLLLDRDAKENLPDVARDYVAYLQTTQRYAALKAIIAKLGRRADYGYSLIEAGQLFSSLDKLKRAIDRIDLSYHCYRQAWKEAIAGEDDELRRRKLASHDWQMRRAMYLWRQLVVINERLYPELEKDD